MICWCAFVLRFPFASIIWCLMSNHFHLAVEVDRVEDLSYYQGQVCRRYIMDYHQRDGGSGYLWQGRFRSMLIEKAGYLERLGR